jgi:DNA (cytosine-5)-methyltransferase 1
MYNKLKTDCNKGNLKVACVDLFCGVGGLTHGLIRGGIPVIAGIDVDAYCRFAYEKNNEAIFIERDISMLQGNEVTKIFEDVEIKILAGCAPCQPFST